MQFPIGDTSSPSVSWRTGHCMPSLRDRAADLARHQVLDLQDHLPLLWTSNRMQTLFYPAVPIIPCPQESCLEVDRHVFLPTALITTLSTGRVCRTRGPLSAAKSAVNEETAGSLTKNNAKLHLILTRALGLPPSGPRTWSGLMISLLSGNPRSRPSTTTSRMPS